MRILSYLVLWFCLLLLMPFSAISAEINCYSGKTRIYHGFGNDFIFNDYFMQFTEYKTKHVILMDADCIIEAPVSNGDKLNAKIIWNEEHRA